MNAHFARRAAACLAVTATACAAAACTAPAPSGPSSGVSTQAAAPAVVAAWPIPPGVRTVGVDGYPVAYADAGAGEPVVLIHGAFVDHRFWQQQIDALARTHRVIAPSMHRHWPEPWDGRGEAFSVRRNAADVAGLVRALDLGKVHLVGHSLGGIVAVEVARTNPGMLRSLTLADSGGPASLLGDEYARQRQANSAKLAQFVRSQLDAGDRRTAAQSMWNAMNGPGAWDRMPPTIQQMFADNIGTVTAPPDPAPPGLDCAEVRAWPFPTLLIHGESSPPNYLAVGAALRRCRDDIAPPVVVPKAGHNMQVQNPDAFNAALLSFLSRR
jgi:pimeloyl-ACP methyl ester carboxylesterase